MTLGMVTRKQRIEYLNAEEFCSPRTAMAVEKAALAIVDVLDSGAYEVSGLYDEENDVFVITHVLVQEEEYSLCRGTVELLQSLIESIES